MAVEDSLSGTSERPAGKTIIEEVYNALREGVLDGTLEPESRLRIEELRSRFGVSSSSVREALSRLLAENLVTTEGQRGFRVAPASLSDFEDIAQMRKLLEAEAVRQSVANGDENWEAQLVAAAYRLSKIESSMKGLEKQVIREWEERNRDFHDALISACTNKWLLSMRRILYNHSVRYLRISVTERTIPRDVRAEHETILKAALNKDADLTASLIETHIDRTVAVLSAKIAEMNI